MSVTLLPMPFSRRTLAICGSLAGLLLCVGIAFSPLVRAKVASEAARRHLVVDVGSVRPGFFAVTLRNVGITPENTKGVTLHFDQVKVELGLTLRPREVIAQGGAVSLEGTLDELVDSLRTWRGEPRAEGGSGTHLAWRAEGIAFRWATAPGAEPDATAEGISIERTESGYRVGVEGAKARYGGGSVELATASAELEAAGVLNRAKAVRLVLGYELAANAAGAKPAVSPLEPAPPPLPMVTTKRKGSMAAAAPAAAAPPPQLPLPDVHALRRKLAAVAAVVATRLPEGGVVDVDGLELSLRAGSDRLAVGPGPLRVERTNGNVHVSFSAGDAQAQGSTHLALDVTLPLEAGDVSLQASGGPMPLSVVGVKQGAMGLTDVERATVTGHGRVVLSAPGDSMTFDVDASVRGLALKHAKLSTDTVRGLDFGVSARGVLGDKGELRLDDAELDMGKFHVRAHGAVEQSSEHLAASLLVDVPSTACQELLGSIPSALVPTVQTARMSGTFGAHGRFAFDTRKLDDLVLEYSIADKCRMVEVPAELSQDRFGQPFSHRIYTPEGDIEEETTGPGTDEWTPLDEISPYMRAAVLTTEDGAFMHHKGFSHGAIRNALVANLKAGRFTRGASTISMQVAKNLFLTRDKTLARKLEEIILTDYLEQIFKKDEIMELYLNVIEFGPNVYGVTRAADHFFGRKPSELNLAESLYLASVMPSPIKNYKIYEKGEVPEAWMKHIRLLMEIAEKTGKISKAELAEGLTQSIVFHKDGARPTPRAPYSGVHVTRDDEARWQELN